MKNWSRFVLKIARKRSRARRGIPGSSASASTRALNSSQLSCALRNCSGAPRSASSAAAGSTGTRSSERVTWLIRSASSASGNGSTAGAPLARSAPPTSEPDHSGTSGERAATASAASVLGSRSTGEPTRPTMSRGVNHCSGRPAAVRSRRSRPATHTSSTGRPSVAGTVPSRRTWPSAVPSSWRMARRQPSSPPPSTTRSCSPSPLRRNAIRPSATAMIATSRWPCTERARAPVSGAASSSAARARRSVATRWRPWRSASAVPRRATPTVPQGRRRSASSRNTGAASVLRTVTTSTTNSTSGHGMSARRTSRMRRSVSSSTLGTRRVGSTSARSRRAGPEPPAKIAAASSSATSAASGRPGRKPSSTRVGRASAANRTRHAMSQRLLGALGIESLLAPEQRVDRVLAIVEARDRRSQLLGRAAVAAVEALPHALDPQPGVGDRIARRDHARPVEVVRHREHGPRTVPNHHDVVQRREREVGVPDEVLEHRHEPRVRDLGVELRQSLLLEDLRVLPPRHGVVVFDEEGVARDRLRLSGAVEVRHAREPRAEALLCDQVEDSVEEVLLQQVLLVAVPVLAVDDELQAALAGEHGVLHLLLVERDLQGGEVAGSPLQPEVTPRPQLHVERDGIARGPAEAQDAGVLLL